MGEYRKSTMWGRFNKKMIWIPPQFRESGRNTNFLTKNTFRIWDRLSKRFQWEYNSPLISPTNTNYFKPGKEEHLYFTRRAKKKDVIQLQDVMRGNRLYTYTEITREWGTINHWTNGGMRRYSPLHNLFHHH